MQQYDEAYYDDDVLPVSLSLSHLVKLRRYKSASPQQLFDTTHQHSARKHQSPIASDSQMNVEPPHSKPKSVKIGSPCRSD